MNQTKAHELAQEITALFSEQKEVILETNDIQEFLSETEPVDSVRAMEIIRDISEENQWNSFVYDYGALVRFTRKSESIHSGQDGRQVPVGHE